MNCSYFWMGKSRLGRIKTKVKIQYHVKIIHSLGNLTVKSVLEYLHFFPLMKFNISNILDKMVAEKSSVF